LPQIPIIKQKIENNLKMDQKVNLTDNIEKNEVIKKDL